MCKSMCDSLCFCVRASEYVCVCMLRLWFAEFLYFPIFPKAQEPPLITQDQLLVLAPVDCSSVCAHTVRKIIRHCRFRWERWTQRTSDSFYKEARVDL